MGSASQRRIFLLLRKGRLFFSGETHYMAKILDGKSLGGGTIRLLICVYFKVILRFERIKYFLKAFILAFIQSRVCSFKK